MTKTFAACVKVVTQHGLDFNFAMGANMVSKSNIKNLSTRTWHPHMPGVTTSWLASANGVSERTIRRRRQKTDSSDFDLGILTLETGLELSMLRPSGGVLPIWSRMAIAEYAARGKSYNELSQMFNCSKSTVWRCIKRWPSAYDPLSFKRVLTKQQKALKCLSQ